MRPEHEIGVGDRRLACPRGRSRPVPGSSPALCGPTRSSPPLSIQATEPPPAPIVLRRPSACRRAGPIRSRTPSSGSPRPSAIRLTSKLVPPMSIEIRLLRPVSCPKKIALSTPPTGPETRRSTGFAAAAR